MEHEDLVVKSFFLESSHEVCFYITNFDSITGYMYLASNFNKYYFIITNETESLANMDVLTNENKEKQWIEDANGDLAERLKEESVICKSIKEKGEYTAENQGYYLEILLKLKELLTH